MRLASAPQVFRGLAYLWWMTTDMALLIHALCIPRSQIIHALRSHLCAGTLGWQGGCTRAETSTGGTKAPARDVRVGTPMLEGLCVDALMSNFYCGTQWQRDRCRVLEKFRCQPSRLSGLIFLCGDDL